MTKLTWGAPERNKSAILEVLARTLPKTGLVLEIASGSGQHVVHFAAALPGLEFQPSDVDAANLASIRSWIDAADLSNIRPPLSLDVCAPNWHLRADAIFNANMIHIAPWKCAIALFEGASRHLSDSGVLVLYGPFHIDGRPTADSNVAFDADLRRRDPSWGVRDLKEVRELAERTGLELALQVAMPANNQLVVFRKRAS